MSLRNLSHKSKQNYTFSTYQEELDDRLKLKKLHVIKLTKWNYNSYHFWIILWGFSNIRLIYKISRTTFRCGYWNRVYTVLNKTVFQGVFNLEDHFISFICKQNIFPVLLIFLNRVLGGCPLFPEKKLWIKTEKVSWVVPTSWAAANGY